MHFHWKKKGAKAPEEPHEEKPHQGTLAALDTVKTSAFHFRSVVVAGSGFFTDAYDLFSIGLLGKLLGRIYYQGYKMPLTPGVLPINITAAINGVALCGTLAGQIFFGLLGDRFGRKSMYGATLIIMILSSVGQACTFGPPTHSAVFGTLCFFRFWLGFGVGGDYPLSSVIMSEYSSKKNRGAFVAAVFAMQGVGILTAAAVTIIVTAIFRAALGPEHDQPFSAAANYIRANHITNPDEIQNVITDMTTPTSCDYVWRIVLLLSCLPAFFTLYYRLTMPETARFTALVKKDAAKAKQDMEGVMHAEGRLGTDQINTERTSLTFKDFFRVFKWPLIGAAMSWFLLDISFYSQNLLQGQVFTAVGFLPSARSMSALRETYMTARAQAIVALSSTVPGYWVTVFTVDILGRKPIQLMGFFMMTAFMAALAGAYDQLIAGPHAAGFMTLYCLTFFFANFGPNATTFIIPAELFPARWRTTGHGICAAAGKAGAIVGAFGFLYASQSPDPKVAAAKGYPTGIGTAKSLAILAATNGAGIFFTLLVPETKGKSLEELSGEASPASDTSSEAFGVNGAKAKAGSSGSSSVPSRSEELEAGRGVEAPDGAPAPGAVRAVVVDQGAAAL